MLKNTVIKSVSIFMGLILVGWLMNIVAFLLPWQPIHQNVLNSVPTFQREGAFPPVIGENYRNTLADNNTDAWMMLMADYEDDKSVVEKSLGGYYKTYEGAQSTGLIGMDNIVVMTDDTSQISGEGMYSRYWHGWMLPLRLLLIFFSYENIRYISMNAILVLLGLNIYALLKKGLTEYAVAFFAANTFVLPITAMISFEYAFSYYVMMIGNLLLIYKQKFIREKIGYPAFFMSIGMTIAYFDFLTYPLITLGTCLVTWYFLENEQMSIVNAIKGVFLFSIMWGIGYAGTWLAKWTIATLVLDQNVFKEAFNQVALRTSASTGLGVGTSMEPTITYLDVLKNNLTVFKTRGYLCSFMVFTSYFGYKVFKMLREDRIRKMQKSLLSGIFFGLIAIMPFAWCFVLQNHTYIHRNFTSNVFALTILAFFGFFAMMVSRKQIVWNQK